VSFLLSRVGPLMAVCVESVVWWCLVPVPSLNRASALLARGSSEAAPCIDCARQRRETVASPHEQGSQACAYLEGLAHVPIWSWKA
jgi:hypothetical protein